MKERTSPFRDYVGNDLRDLDVVVDSRGNKGQIIYCPSLPVDDSDDEWRIVLRREHGGYIYPLSYKYISQWKLTVLYHVFEPGTLKYKVINACKPSNDEASKNLSLEQATRLCRKYNIAYGCEDEPDYFVLPESLDAVKSQRRVMNR